MPPPAAPKKVPDKAAKKSTGAEESLSAEDEKVFLQRQLEALKLQLEKESLKALQAELAVKETRAQFQELQAAAKAAEDKTLNISIDMARQYSSMKQQLLTQLSTLEHSITQQATAHAADRTAWQSERSEWQAALQQREQAIDSERARREEMATEFGVMLQRTLDKMAERLEVTNDWEGEGAGKGGGAGGGVGGVGGGGGGASEVTVRTLEEFSIGGNGKIGMSR